jgi:outer membrane biosynthesis protein TonB
MAQKPVQKILRIGLFSSGKFIEEKLIHSRKAVTAGSDFKGKSLFILPASKLPASMVIFDVDKEGRYVLKIHRGMTGKVSTGDGSYSVQELVSSGKAKKNGEHYDVVLTPKHYGRVAIGSGEDEIAFLFQFVTPPPPRAKPVLPANMRGGVITGILASTILFVTCSISAVVQVGFIAFLLSRDWPEPKDMEYQLPDRFVSVMVDKKEEETPEPEPVETDEGDGPGEAESDEPSNEPAPDPEPKEEKSEPKTAEERAAAEAERRKALAESVKNKTILGRIGAVSADGNIVDALADGAGRTSMEDAFANSTGVTTGAAGAEKSGLRTGGSSAADGKGSSVGIGDLGKSSGAKKAAAGVKTGSKSEAKVKARVKDMPEKVVGTGTLDSGSISSTLKRRMSRIKGCYERHLKKDPSAGGKIIVNFTIGTAGRVTKATATTDSVGGGVGKCVAGQIQRIKFPRPKGGEVMVNKTWVFEPSQ